MVGVYEHLHPPVLAQVERGVAIHSLRLSMLQFLHHHVECLLIGLYELGLRGVCHTVNAWRQHVVHRCLVIVLLDVHGTHLHRTTLGTACTEALLVEAPLSAYEVEGSEAQYDGLLETRHEHTHEADAGQVADATLLVLILRQGNAELVPVHAGRITVTELHATGTHVGDETVGRRSPVAIGIEYLWRDAHLILEIALKLIEGEVLIEVFHIRAALVTGVIRLGLLIRVG